MKVQLNREQLPNCTPVERSGDLEVYAGSLLAQVVLASLGILPNLLLVLALSGASRLSQSLRWILISAFVAGVFIDLHFLIRGSLRLADLKWDEHFCVISEEALVTPSSCMLEEAPWTAALFYLSFFPFWLCVDRLLCSTWRLRRARKLGKYGVLALWVLGWTQALVFILQAKDMENLHYCHHLFPYSEGQQSVGLWAAILSSFAVLTIYSYVIWSNRSLLRRALNRAIFYPATRIRILDTVAVNRSLFPALLTHILVFTPLALAFFAIQNDVGSRPGTWLRFATINFAYVAVLVFILLFPFILLFSSTELQGSLVGMARKLGQLVTVERGQKEDLDLPGEYETAMAALIHSTIFGSATEPLALAAALSAVHHPRPVPWHHDEPEDEDHVVHL